MDHDSEANPPSILPFEQRSLLLQVICCIGFAVALTGLVLLAANFAFDLAGLLPEG